MQQSKHGSDNNSHGSQQFGDGSAPKKTACMHVCMCLRRDRVQCTLADFCKLLLARTLLTSRLYISGVVLRPSTLAQILCLHFLLFYFASAIATATRRKVHTLIIPLLCDIVFVWPSHP